MKKNHIIFILPVALFAQEKQQPKFETGYYDTNKFSQMYDYWLRPICSVHLGRQDQLIINNRQIIKLILSWMIKAKLSGSETITYYNNSPDSLEYLWIQLDQNQAARF
jgi:hypothetical protein